jgi:type VI secretion system protein VasD
MIRTRSIRSASRGAALGSLLTVAMLCGCGSSTILPVKDAAKACELQTVKLSVIASTRLNPTTEGEPRPVVLRIYQLKDDIRLQNATFDQLWKDDKAALAEDIVAKNELYAYPNSRTEVKFERIPEARYVAGAALFRGHQGKSWFISFELPPPPGKGDCGQEGCEDEGCKGINLTPRFVLWMDGVRVEEGSNHLDDVTEGSRVRVVDLGKSGAGDVRSQPAPAASKP